VGWDGIEPPTPRLSDLGLLAAKEDVRDGDVRWSVLE
jgi:hypothetical protein